MTVIKKDEALLGALVALLVARPLLAGGGVASRGILAIGFAGVFLAVVHLIFTRRRERLSGLVLFALIFSSTALHFSLAGRLPLALEVVFHASMVAFAGFAVFVILRDLFEKRDVGGSDIFAVVSGFLLSGIAWGSLYALTYLVEPGSFGVDPSIAAQLQEWPLRRALFDYLSFATLTTLGYDYLTPATPFADTLTWLELMFGQFYMAIVVAQLVGMKLARAVQPEN